MNEKQFLELSDRKRDQFIERKVYGRNRAHILPYHTTHWEGMGKGIEHANENDYFVHLTRSPYGRASSTLTIFDKNNMATKHTATAKENIFLAFWTAYMKALGVLE